jgi:hypothetical protein
MDEDGGFLLSNMKKSLEVTRLDDLTAEWIIFKCSAVGKFRFFAPPSSGSVTDISISHPLEDILAYGRSYSDSTNSEKRF